MKNFVRGPSESVHNLCFGNRNYSQTSKICVVSAVYAGISVGHHVFLKIRYSLVSFRAWVHNQDGTVYCAIHLCLGCLLNSPPACNLLRNQHVHPLHIHVGECTIKLYLQTCICMSCCMHCEPELFIFLCVVFWEMNALLKKAIESITIRLDYVNKDETRWQPKVSSRVIWELKPKRWNKDNV